MSKRSVWKKLRAAVPVTLRKGFALLLCAVFALETVPLCQVAAAYAEEADGSSDGITVDDDAAAAGAEDSAETAEDADENAVMGSSVLDGSESSGTGEAAAGAETLAEVSEPAESWRYEDGEPIENPSTEDTSLLSTLSSTYSTWEESYGTGYLGIVSGSTTYTVEIDGVERVGIDVSKWQGTIDWDEVADAGIDFAIIRCGWGSDLESQDDECFIQNVEGAQEAGLDIGIYLYSYATTVSGSDGSAMSEAEHVLRLLEEAGLEPEDLAYPIFLDMEDSSTTGLGSSLLGDIAETFCNMLEAEGYTTGIYANKNWWENYLTDSYFEDVENKWVARYPRSTSITSTGVDGTDIWQFTSHGSVSGITGNVDVDFDYNQAGSYTGYSNLFLDALNASSYYYDAIYALADLGYLEGYSNGKFGVGDKMTREQFVTILWRIACPDEYAAYDNDADNATGLSDVGDDAYYTAAVNWARENEIMLGHSDGSFGVGESITFEDMCVVLARYACGGEGALEEALAEDEAAEVLEGFSDAGSVSGYAEKGMAWCVGEGLVSGNSDGTLAPTTKVARERAATVIWRAVEAGYL